LARDRSHKEITVSLTRMHAIATIAWLVLVLGVLSVRISTAGAPTLAESAGWLLLGTLPILVVYRVFRGAPPNTVAQVLYNTEHDGDATQSGPRHDGTA
jgi:ABC-type nickel/cobalt efflux system permease component RcnA